MRRGEYKCRILEMHLKLKDWQHKTILYIYRLLYQNFMGTANPKTTIGTHRKEKATQTKHENHKKREQKRKERKKTYKNKPKTIKKIAMGTYISIISLKLNVPTKRHRLTEWIQKQDPCIYMLSTRDPLQTWGDIQTESEGMERRYFMKMEITKNGGSNIHIGQIDFKTSL